MFMPAIQAGAWSNTASDVYCRSAPTAMETTEYDAHDLSTVSTVQQKRTVPTPNSSVYLLNESFHSLSTKKACPFLEQS